MARPPLCDFQSTSSAPCSLDRPLIDDSLYIALYNHHAVRPLPRDFHWTLYHHVAAPTGGTRYQIQFLGAEGHYVPAHAHAPSIACEGRLLGLLRVAEVPHEMRGELDRIVRSSDARLLRAADGSHMGCRSWALDVLQMLANQDAVGGRNMLCCLNVGELEEEAIRFAEECADLAGDCEDPRPVKDSEFVK